MFLEQQSRQADADPEAQREAFYKAQALKIVNAGLRARGMPLRTCLIQDEPFQPLFDQTPSEEYPPDSNGPSKDPDDADDSPVDDRKDKTKKSKKSKKVQEDDEDAEEKDESDGDTDTNPDKQKSGAANPQPGETIDQYWQRVRSTARAITRAGDRRRGLIR
jgi:hypothetical protein